MATGPAYCTREAVMAATNFGSVIADKIDRALFAKSRLVEQQLHRLFYPLTAAYTFHDPYDKTTFVSSRGFWFNKDLRSVTSITVDGTAETTYTLLPKDGPPYSRIAIDGYDNVDTVITGVWGYSADTAAAGQLDGAVGTTTAATIKCSNEASIGVGDLILVNTERMIVTDKTTVDSTANTNGALTAEKSNNTITVTDGTAFNVGERILIESEKADIEAITGNDLQVERAVDGTTLAAHNTATDVYVYRTLSVTRGAAGSTAATHSDTDTITRNVPPGPIRDYCIALAINQLAQEISGYARTAGSGDNQQEATGRAIRDIRNEAWNYVRQRQRGI